MAENQTNMTTQKNPNQISSDMDLKVPLKGYIFLILGIVMFSGVFSKMTNALGILDYTVLLGKYGTIVEGAAAGFRGSGGVGARDGFIFALTALPSVGLAIGIIAVIEGQGGLKAAQKLLTPLLRPLMGIPGCCGLAIIGSLQNTDTGSAMCGQLRDDNQLTDQEVGIFSAFLFGASATIAQYFGTAVILFAFMEESGVAPIIPFVVMLAGKVFSANVMRLYIYITEERKMKNGSKE